MDYVQILSPSRDLNTGPADYKSAALPAKPLGRHRSYAVLAKKVVTPEFTQKKYYHMS